MTFVWARVIWARRFVVNDPAARLYGVPPTEQDRAPHAYTGAHRSTSLDSTREEEGEGTGEGEVAGAEEGAGAAEGKAVGEGLKAGAERSHKGTRQSYTAGSGVVLEFQSDVSHRRYSLDTYP